MEESTNRELNDNGQPKRADQDFEDIEIAEEELIDAYVHNELAADERKLVEKGLRRSPQLVARLHFARMLVKASSSAREFVSPPVESEILTDRAQAEPVKIPWWKGFFSAPLVPRPAFRVALAVCVIFVLVGGVALIVGWMKLRDDSNRLARERAAVEQQRLELEKRLAAQQLSSEQLAAELQKERQQREAAERLFADLKLQQKPNDQSDPSAISNFASIVLLPGTRGSAANVLPVSPAASEIRLGLSLESAEYRRYQVAIQDVLGKAIVQPIVRARHNRSGPILSIRVPARRLPKGDYQIHVSGVTSSGALEPVEDYVLRITEKKE